MNTLIGSDYGVTVLHADFADLNADLRRLKRGYTRIPTRRNTQCSMCLTPNEAQRLGATRMRARVRQHCDRTVSRSTDAARPVSTARHAADRTGTNKGACPLAERGEATHSVRDGSSVENRSANPLASRTGCNINGQWLFLPNSHSSRNGGAVSPRTDGACTVSTTAGHGGRTAFRSRDVARHVSTTAGTATDASRLNCDFNRINLIEMIPLNHENHINHMEITVQTNK
jgi:hypothetical protein